MSGANLARRTRAEIAFSGVDITSSMQPYLLSLTYTDNEEDEADDLQIKLQDRVGLWLESWLKDMIDAAASTPVSAPASGGGFAVGDTVQFTGSKHYVSSTGDKGYTAKPGPAKITASNPGSKHPWHLIHTDSTSNVYGWVNEGDFQSLDGAGGSAAGEAAVSGFQIQSTIVRENWNGDGTDEVLDCGEFELDSLTADGPPATVTIKSTSLPYSAAVRQTEKSRAWESASLSAIAGEIAAANGMVCMYESAFNPFYARVEQYKTSDIAFLSQLCHNAGISLKATSRILVLFDQAAYESKASVFTIKRGAGGYTKYKLNIGTADTQYSSCRVSYVDPASGRCIEGFAYAEGYKADSEKNQQLEITAKVSSIAEAQLRAQKLLRLHNKYAKTAVITLPGNPALVAGVTVVLEGWGVWDGKYIVKQAKHTVSGGYTTQVKLRRCLEGY